MKKVGLIGGISWVSTLDYYKYINEGINAHLGGLNFAECLIYSLNFAEVQDKSWDRVFTLLVNAAEDLQKAGVEGIALCANTAHMHADALGKVLPLPLIHIGDATSSAIKAKGLHKVGLLGTQFTMEMDFYTDRLRAHGLEVIIPESQEARDYIQHTVKEELGRGIIRPETKEQYLAIINELATKGAEGIILGCTEIPLLISQADLALPAFDTTRIHSEAIVSFMLS